MEAKLKPLSDFLGKKEWFVGDTLTIADFIVYDCIFFHNAVAPEALCKISNLKAHMERFEALPKMQKFFASDKNYKDLVPSFAPYSQKK